MPHTWQGQYGIPVGSSLNQILSALIRVGHEQSKIRVYALQTYFLTNYYCYYYYYYVTAIGLIPGGSSTHLHTNSTQNTEDETHWVVNWEVRAVPRVCELYPGICLTTEEKHGKTSVRVVEKCPDIPVAVPRFPGGSCPDIPVAYCYSHKYI
jgi:hypothetical protein